MSKKKRVVIVGATSAIAEHCARLWALGSPLDLTLLGRDTVRMERIATDLRIRSPQSMVEVIQADFLDPAAITATVERVFDRRPVDLVLIAHGFLPAQAGCQDDLQSCHEALLVNGVSPVLYAEAFAKGMTPFNHGTVALIGSVAGDRGRKSNYVYGSAKGLVSRYAQGLQHRFAGSGIKVVLIKPGPTDTPMTAHLKAQGSKLASVEVVAQSIVDAIERGQTLVYAPGKWRLIMWVIRHLPAAIFNKLNI